VYVKAPDHSYLDVPYADIRLPPISVWELRAARRFLAQRGDPKRNQERLFWAHGELHRIVAQSIKETRRVRRQRGRKEGLVREQSLAAPPGTSAKVAETVDYNQDPNELPTETWAPKGRS